MTSYESTDSPRGAPRDAPSQDLGVRLAYRSAKVLEVIAVVPGSSNVEISTHAGIRDQGQASKLLARLAREGLIENTRAVPTKRITNAWRLTRKGEALESAMRAMSTGHEADGRGRT